MDRVFASVVVSSWLRALIKLEKPEDLLRSRVTVISNVIEFGWNIDIFLNLFQLSTKQKRLN